MELYSNTKLKIYILIFISNSNIASEMPTMGHGSPNNVNPAHTSNGHYMGKINFTMTGLWRVNLKISEGSKMLKDDLSFDITF